MVLPQLWVEEGMMKSKGAVKAQVGPVVNPEGIWPKDDLRRAFVEGATWWEWYETKFTMWNSDRRLAEAEAEKKYPGGKLG